MESDEKLDFSSTFFKGGAGRGGGYEVGEEGDKKRFRTKL